MTAGMATGCPPPICITLSQGEPQQPVRVPMYPSLFHAFMIITVPELERQLLLTCHSCMLVAGFQVPWFAHGLVYTRWL